MGKIDNIDVWIKLYLNDLKCARILYEHKEFRNSYYLFQQATEKANKAFTLKFELANEEDIRNMGHDIFKFNRRFATKRIQELEVHFPKITTEYEKLKKGLSEVDSLKNKDLVNFHGKLIQGSLRYVFLNSGFGCRIVCRPDDKISFRVW